ncbi:hypothetical protein [Lactobacillus helveticus]|uniref:hypothetical protein n=1 Tax=Lactobacillus helveticus TaxID=1587 RepID=UPI001FAF69FB|nr:hypothetical protein [Lactobacillus helveticus]
MLYDFSMFMHLLLVQGIVISLYLVVGWIFDRGDPIIRMRKRDTLWETITSIRLTKLFFLRLFEGLILFIALGSAIRFSRQLWNILFEMPFKFKLSDTAMNIMLYGDFAYVLIMVGLAIGILAANKRFIRVASVITIFLAIVLLLAKSPLLITNILGMLVSLIGIWFSYRAKL